MIERATEDLPSNRAFPAEVDNARIAYSWAVREHDTDTACLLAAALMIALTPQGGAKEAVRRCEEALRLGSGSRVARCTCEIAAARAGQFAYDASTAWSHALAARDLLPLDDDLTVVVWNTVAMAALTAPTDAEPSFDACLSVAREHDPPGDAFFDFLEGLHRLHHGRFEESVELFERSDRKALTDREASEADDLPTWHAACRVNSALARFLWRGDTALDDETIDEVERAGQVVLFSELRRVQVVLAAARQQPFDELLDESLRVVRDAGLPIGTWLDLAASAAWFSGDPDVAVQLWGARGVGQAWTGELGPHLQPIARTTLGELEYDRLSALGASMSNDQAIELGFRATTT